MQHALVQPVRLPDAVWTSEQTQALLRTRRVGELFLLAKKHAGASQARIAAATGLNQGEVSRIQRGDRWVTAIDVLERIADGLAMPDQARVLLGLAPVHRPLTVPAQLPPAVSGFGGRAREQAWLKDHRDAGCVLVTGPGGMGKTALALAWAHRASFPDGQLFVDMTDLDPADALAGFLRALGGPVPPTVRERTAAFRSLLAGRRMLVVVDNAASAGQVLPLLPGSSGCLVVVTSRDPLDDLVVRAGAAALRLGPLPPDEALDLVVRVAGRARVEADPDQAAAVVERGGGSPLALRAAAVQLGEAPVQTDRTRWPALAGMVGASALTVVAGVVGLSDVVDKTTLHAVVATRGGQLTTLGLLILAGCIALLRPISRLTRPLPAAGCLLGVAATVVATVVRTPSGPPALVDTVALVGVAVWTGTVAVAARFVLPRHGKWGYVVGAVLGIGGSWIVVGRFLQSGTATNQTYSHLLIGGVALAFAMLGVRRRSRGTSGRSTASVAVVASVAVLLVASVLATVPAPAAPRGRHRAYDEVVYGRDIESPPSRSHTGPEPERLVVEAQCETSPCSLSPA
jgi:hypothetical protein